MTNFKQRDIANAMRLVVRNGFQHAGNQRSAQHALFSDKWIGKLQSVVFTETNLCKIAWREKRIGHRFASTE